MVALILVHSKPTGVRLYYSGNASTWNYYAVLRWC